MAPCMERGDNYLSISGACPDVTDCEVTELKIRTVVS